jgi:hypothetical protein
LPLGHCVVAEAGCNWYRLDINIYSLSKKRIHTEHEYMRSQARFTLHQIGSKFVFFSLIMEALLPDPECASGMDLIAQINMKYI